MRADGSARRQCDRRPQSVDRTVATHVSNVKSLSCPGKSQLLDQVDVYARSTKPSARNRNQMGDLAACDAGGFQCFFRGICSKWTRMNAIKVHSFRSGRSWTGTGRRVFTDPLIGDAMRNARVSFFYERLAEHCPRQTGFSIATTDQVGRHGNRFVQAHRVLGHGCSQSEDCKWQ